MRLVVGGGGQCDSKKNVESKTTAACLQICLEVKPDRERILPQCGGGIDFPGLINHIYSCSCSQQLLQLCSYRIH